jgi:serine/threonine protein kinase
MSGSYCRAGVDGVANDPGKSQIFTDFRETDSSAESSFILEWPLVAEYHSPPWHGAIRVRRTISRGETCMATDTKLARLLQRYQELQQAGQTTSAEELCGDCPELLDELKGQIAALASADTALGPGHSSDRETQGGPGRLAGTLQPGMLAAQPTADHDLPPAPSEHLKTDGLEIRPGGEPVPGYHLVGRLGRGNFGEVWKAIAPGGFPVALKIVPLQERGKASELHALEIIKNIRHPNLVTSFGAWEREGCLIIAMELADRTLWDRFQEAADQNLPGIPSAELLEYLREAAKGIDYLNQPHHALGGKQRLSIQHRDIKPQNILLVGNSVKVADFGLVRLLERSLTSHTGSMTPAYAAPEFLRGHTSSQSDQYCLAVTYCELRGGRLPFRGTMAEVLHGHLSNAPDLSMLPESERPAVLRALAKEPGERWPSCRAFVERLAEGMAGEARAQPRPKPHGSRRLVLPVAAVLVGLTVVFLPSLLRMPPEPIPAGKKESPQQEVDTERTATHRSEQDGSRAEDTAARQSAKDRPEQQADASVVLGDRTAASRPADEIKTAAIPQSDPVATAQLRDESKTPAKEAQTLPQLEVRAAAAENAPAATTSPVDNAPTAKRSSTTAEQPRIGELRQFVKHRGPVRSVAISPNGHRALSGGDDSLVRLWETETGQELDSFSGHIGVVHCLAFSRDGRLAVSAGEDKVLRLWDLEARAAIGTLNGHSDAVYSVAFSSDHTQVISGGNDTSVRVWSIEDAKELSRFEFPPREAVYSLALSPDNRHVLTASDSTIVRLWNVERASEVHRFLNHRDVVWCVAYSSDGSRALSGGGYSEANRDYALRLWDIENRKIVRELKGHTGDVVSVAFSSDGRRAISGATDKTMRLWDVDSGEELRCFEGHTAGVHCVAISRDGQRALSASQDGTVRVWGLPQ